MRSAIVVAAVAFSGFAGSQQPALNVLRVSPSGTAAPTDIVTVAFDRPVAGQLDGTIDPRTIFSIAPAVQGRVEWRDPITLQFDIEAPKPLSETDAGIGVAITAPTGNPIVSMNSLVQRVPSATGVSRLFLG